MQNPSFAQNYDKSHNKGETIKKKKGIEGKVNARHTLNRKQVIE